MRDMSDEDFEQHIQGLITVKKQKFRELVKETVFYWNEISKGCDRFNNNIQTIEMLSNIKKEEFIQFTDKLLHKTPKLVMRSKYDKYY